MKAPILVSLVLMILFTSCSDDKELIAKNYLSQQLSSQSTGALMLSSFKKTNGYKKNELSEEYYILEWEMQVKSTRAFWKAPTDMNGFVWGNYGVIEESDFENPQIKRELLMLGQPMSRYYHCKLNSVIKLFGFTRMFKTEKGWRATEAKVTRAEF